MGVIMKKTVICIILILFFIMHTYSELPGNGILALYKSSDSQTEEENEIYFYLSRLLTNMGFEITYHDIDSGTPGNLDEYRAIITWFRGSSLKYPENYLDFVNEAIDSGKKFIVIDNFGAYQNRRTEEYVDTALINLTLQRLGIIYLGDWTDETDVIEIVYRDSGLMSDIPSDSGFFYRYLTVDRNLRVYLSLQRTDREYEPSPVVVSNKNGGFALTKYIYIKDNGNVSFLLDLQLFLENILFPEPIYENILLLADPEDEKLVRITEHTKSVLTMAKLPFEIIEKENFGLLLPGDLNRFTVTGIILKDDSELNPEVLSDYLENGGSIVCLYGGNFSSLKTVLALSNKTETAGPHSGYQFSYGFMFGEGVFLEDSKLAWTNGPNLPSDDAVVIAYDYIRYTPLLWTEDRGTGKILYWNWDGFNTGEGIGFILESFLYVRPVGVAANAGLGIMFVDDWPLPMFNIVKEPLTITDTKFYTENWWNDIREIFSDYNIPFTNFLIFNYNSTVEPPFSGIEFYAADGFVTADIGNEILSLGEELAFHGFNHMSLTREDTEVNLNNWPSVSNMEESLMQARLTWINLFGEHTLPFSYVAPNNIISEDGIRAIHNVFPGIKVISALRSGLGEESFFSFGPNKEFPDIYMIPRNTWGYHFTDQIQRLIVSSMSGAGVWAHFIHADDVLSL